MLDKSYSQHHQLTQNVEAVCSSTILETCQTTPALLQIRWPIRGDPEWHRRLLSGVLDFPSCIGYSVEETVVLEKGGLQGRCEA